MTVPLRRTPSNRPRRKPLDTEQFLDDFLNDRLPKNKANWPVVPCAEDAPHVAHQFLGRCGFPEWCPGAPPIGSSSDTPDTTPHRQI